MERIGKTIQLDSKDAGVVLYTDADWGSLFYIDRKPSNFHVQEFACNDGSDNVLIDSALVIKLQAIRDRLGEVRINSAFRTAEHNKRVGGVPSSYHVLGKAADIRTRFPYGSAMPLLIAMQADLIGFNGIGVYDTFAHVDTREKPSVFNYSKYAAAFPLFAPVMRGVSAAYTRHVILLQALLRVPVDGVCGVQTVDALTNWQARHGLTIDGICGQKTWRSLLEHMRGGVVIG